MMEATKYTDFIYYTYGDYVEWEERWELIDGVAYAMSPAPYPKHQKIVAYVWRELDSHLNCNRCEVYIAPVDWKIDESSVVQPDVAIFCEETTKQYFSQTPPIVVEVLSKSTALKDVTTKYHLYERMGVEFYIIIEPSTELSDIFRLVDGKYQLIKKFTKEDSYRFEWGDGCSSEIDFGRVFSKPSD
jgi:Uma2 family endonuclease